MAAMTKSEVIRENRNKLVHPWLETYWMVLVHSPCGVSSPGSVVSFVLCTDHSEDTHDFYEIFFCKKNLILSWRIPSVVGVVGVGVGRHVFQTSITLAVLALSTSNLVCRRLVALARYFHQYHVCRLSRSKMAAKKLFWREKVVRPWISEPLHAREPKPAPFER